jgi:signal transduction histidine kinase
MEERTVLIVGDEPATVRAIAATLDQEGLQTVVSHGVDGSDVGDLLALARREEPDLVVLDVALAQPLGAQVCAELGADSHMADVPLILIAHDQDSADGSALPAGAQRCLSKPFSPTELVAVVNEILGGQPVEVVSRQRAVLEASDDQLVIYAEELKELLERERIERMALEEARRRLNEVERLKSAFLGVVTHELMTPFASIGLALQVLQQVSGDFRPDQVAALDNLATEIGDLHQLLNGVVKFAELVSKQRDPQPGYYSLGEVIPAAVHPVAVLAQARQVDFRLFVPADLPRVYVDPELVGEAVFQMAHNAIKFNQPGGHAEMRAHESIGWVVIEVSDNGAGLTEERLSLLGQAFEQSADALRRGKEGLGIGWTFVCYVAEVHDGWTRVKSPGPGQGSTFSLALPMPPSEPELAGDAG